MTAKPIDSVADAALEPRNWAPPLAIGLVVLALAACTSLLAEPLSNVLKASPAPGTYDPERMVLLYATLPRLTMAVLCGAGLAAAGAILQQVLRNPLASPTTLGIDAGARLSLALVTLIMPSMLGVGRDIVALAGSCVTTLIVFAIGRRRGFSAVAIVLAGLVVSLYCSTLSAILVLVKDRTLASLFIWGSGSLSQQSWGPCIALSWRLLLVGVGMILMLRPLSLMDLGEESVRSLGLPVQRLRLLSIGAAVLLSAFVTSTVGVIGFIGLVAPALARVAGARRFGPRLLWSTVIGAALLLLTDAVLQNLDAFSAAFVPTGAVTAVLGSPLLLLLLPRLRSAARAAPALPPARPVRLSTHVSVGLVVILLLVPILLAIFVGRGAVGQWQITSADQWSTVLTWRMPRLIAAASAGAMLGVAGLVLQRLTGNEMASPEVLGISAGSILAVAVALFAFGPLGAVTSTSAAVIGSLSVLFLILLLGRRTGYSPETVLLAGIALSALIDAVVGVLSASGDPRAITLLNWMGGSTNGTTSGTAWAALAGSITLVGLSLFTHRWLAIIPLGGPTARALGVNMASSRFVLLLLVATLTAVATPLIGPLTFVGLMAPHIAMAIGIRRVMPALLVAAASGAGVMAVADWLARTAVFPLQLPTGLVAGLIGTPFLIFLLSRRATA